MKKVFDLTSFIALVALILCVSSCSKESISPDPNSTPDDPSIGKTKGSCVANINDLDISINWSSDCTSAQIILALCCNCSNIGSYNCSVAPGLLEIQVENAPYQYWDGSANVQSQSLRPNTCVPFIFNVPVGDGGQIYITQLFFNGQNINVNPYTGNFCL